MVGFIHTGMLAAASAEAIAGRLLATGLTALVAAVISCVVCIAILKTREAEQDRRLADNAEDLKAIGGQVNFNKTASVEAREKLHIRVTEVSNARAACELEASRRFATQAQFVRAVQDVNTLKDQLREEIDQSAGRLHERINELVEQLSQLRGHIQGLKQ